jgi:xanthine dehydrogenase accessory factor
MSDWLEKALILLRQGESCVLVTIVGTHGSTPRETGSKMLVHAAGIAGSIGGGHLEFKAIERARALIASPEVPPPEVAEFALGPGLGQCCGGRLRLLFETLGPAAIAWLEDWQNSLGDRVLATRLDNGSKMVLPLAGTEFADLPPQLHDALIRFAEGGEPAVLAGEAEAGLGYFLERMISPVDDLYLFGAGHVGRALVHVLCQLPYRIRWFDGRPEMFPGELPANVAVEVSAEPRRDAGEAAPGTLFLVMTHSHALDFEICEQVLRRGDFAFLGVIGSASKRASFIRRLRARGYSDAAIGRLTCPIGLPGLSGKLPAAIAVSVAGQLLTVSQAIRDRGQPPIPAAGRHPRRHSQG